jgi:hypothetical protein
MAIDFPNSPAPGDNYTVSGKTWTFTDGKWALNVNSLGVVGPTGPSGPQGATGLQGASGTPSTVSGPQGISGISGVPGSNGVDGVTGPQGPSGVPGTWATSQTIVSGTTYTPSSADVGKMIQLTNSSAINITVNGGLGLTAGQSIDFLRFGTGTVTFNGSATIRYTPGLKLRDQYSAATLFCVSTDTYALIGDLSA